VTFVRTGAGDCADGCDFDQVTVGKGHASELLPAGTRVLKPCRVCGVPALEAMVASDHALVANEKAFARFLADRLLTLYHWAPAARRNQIIRYGLRPGQRPTTHTDWRASYICFADTASWAWALSGAMPYTSTGAWDLWQTRLDRLTDPYVVPADWSNGIHEVRTGHRLYKRDLWHVATRVKESARA
jgi:hypothetical protein